jgi:predicted glycoside hydrolase/deacetylase ChbG (UPF0249 family)
MVRWPAAADAAAYGRQRPKFSLGLHVDLGEWVYHQESWSPLYEVVPLSDSEPVKEEVERQLTTFRRLVGKDPSHIDSHQHVHLREPARSVLLDVARDLHVPLRHFNRAIRYCGNFYGQTTEGAPLSNVLTVEGLMNILATLAPGLTELSCHPGQGDDLDTMYNSERREELKILCDPGVPTAILSMGIELCSFSTLPIIYWQRSEALL